MEWLGDLQVGSGRGGGGGGEEEEEERSLIEDLKRNPQLAVAWSRHDLRSGPVLRVWENDL